MNIFACQDAKSSMQHLSETEKPK